MEGVPLVGVVAVPVAVPMVLGVVPMEGMTPGEGTVAVAVRWDTVVVVVVMTADMILVHSEATGAAVETDTETGTGTGTGLLFEDTIR